MRCVFAGTFDPMTIGHKRIIDICAERYGKVIVVIGNNHEKNTMFTLSERKRIVEKTFEGRSEIEVVIYDEVKNRFADFLKDNGAEVYVRGIRNGCDVNYEDVYKKSNAKLYPFIKTEYIQAEEEFALISSTQVRQAIESGKDIKNFVPQVAYDLIEEFASKRKKV